MRPLVSVIVTVLNEERHLPDLLDSLAGQEPPFEVLIVDAGSRDRTPQIVEAFGKTHDAFHFLVRPGSRGEGRNYAAQLARGEYLAFIDGDCIANAFWLQRLREAARPDTITAGRTPLIGYWAFEKLQRVELPHRGQDVTVPSCNLLYPKEAFHAIGGFDPRFVTAEDIDLNFRAVEAGYRIATAETAVVYHRARESITGFLGQAFWNGYGRKQLTLKHGALWRQYRLKSLVQQQLNPWGLLRAVSGVLGYLGCRLRETRRDWRLPAPTPTKVQA